MWGHWFCQNLLWFRGIFLLVGDIRSSGGIWEISVSSAQLYYKLQQPKNSYCYKQANKQMEKAYKLENIKPGSRQECLVSHNSWFIIATDLHGWGLPCLFFNLQSRLPGQANGDWGWFHCQAVAGHNHVVQSLATPSHLEVRLPGLQDKSSMWTFCLQIKISALNSKATMCGAPNPGLTSPSE